MRGGGGGGVAVPFYPVQDCSPISEEYRLRKSSPFFEITWRGWTPYPCFQVDFSFDSFYGRKLRFASSNWKKELGKGYRYYRNTEMLHKEAPRLQFRFLDHTTMSSLARSRFCLVTQRSSPGALRDETKTAARETSPVQDKITMMKKKTTTTKEI